MPSQKKTDDSDGMTGQSPQDQDIPRRRSSSRLQAKAEKSTADQRETSEEVEILQSKPIRQRSRSRSVGRETKTTTKSEDKLTIVEEEEKETTPGKRGRRSRTTTPTRTLPARAAAKSPSREPSSPVRLTRSARKLGYRTPEAEGKGKESPKLTFAESPLRPPEDEETIQRKASPQTQPPPERMSRDASVPEIIQLSDEEDEPMDVSAAEFIEISTSAQNPTEIFSEDPDITTERGGPVQKEDEDIPDGGKDRDVVVTEEIELEVERTLETKYIFGETGTTGTDGLKDAEEEPEEHADSTAADIEAGLVQQEELAVASAETTEIGADDTKEDVMEEDEQGEKSTGTTVSSGESPSTQIGEKTIEQAVRYISNNNGPLQESSRIWGEDLTTPSPVQETETQTLTTEITPNHENLNNDGEDSTTIKGPTPKLLQSVSSETLLKKKKNKTKSRSPIPPVSEEGSLPLGNEVVGVETAGVEKRKNKKKKASMKGEKTETLDIESKKKTNEPVKITVDVEEGRQGEKDATCNVLSDNQQTKVKKGKKNKKVPFEQVDSERDNGKKQTVKPSRTIKERNDTKKNQKMVDSNEHVGRGTSMIEYPNLTLKRLFSEPDNCCIQLTSLLQELYAWSNKNQRRTDDLPDTFLNNDSETMWQFIAHKNRQIDKDWRKHKALLDEPIAVSVFFSDIGEEDESEEEASIHDENSDKENESDLDDIADEEECDLFNLNDEDLKDLERELEEEKGLQDGSSVEKQNEKPARKYRKSIVDDKFFNLAEMNAFCDEAEKQNEDEEILLTADDSWGGPANYRYEDFFGTLDGVVGNEDTRVQASRKRKALEPNKTEGRKKSVRFALEDEDAEVTEAIEEVQNVSKSTKTLFGDANTEEVESRLKTDIRKLKESIRKYEEENLQPRTWELSGEVTGQQRAENELLETHLQFDNTAKRAPEITEEFTERIEALIKQRIKDQAFDDVVRIKKIDEKREAYRNEAIEEQETMKKSLSEVYEKEYQKSAGQSENSEKINPLHKELEERMNSLFNLIDAMSHFEYTPPTVRPEIKVVSNMAALQMEEVGMQASTDAQLLAPEEIRRKQKGELKADEERTKTDKLRQRRKKKTKQRVMIDRVGVEKALAGQIEKKLEKKKGVDRKEDNLKSSNFFSKLQETVQKELKDKTTKKKKVKSEKVKAGGSKFKL